MNWYKKAQQITIDNIIWAIDKIIAERYAFSEEELLQAFNRLSYNQEWISKAAQSTKTRKNPIGYSRSPTTYPLLIDIDPTDKEILSLFNMAFNPREIGLRMGMSTAKVSKILKKYFPSKKEQIDYLTKKYEKNILDVTQRKSDEMKKDFNIYAITIDDIAEELHISPKFVQTILNNNKIKLKKLLAERRDKIAELIVEIVNSFNVQPPIGDVVNLFYKRYNFKPSDRSIFSAMKLRNAGAKARNDPSTILKAFTTFINNTVRGGVKSFINRPENLPVIIDKFFIDYGTHHGFAPPINKEVLRRMFMTKIQLRERIEENIRNKDKPRKYDPIITDETHPSYFLTDRKQDVASDSPLNTRGNKKMNWYKIARGIPGGLADKKKPSDFDKTELEIGENIELEHTNNKELSKDIAMDHLEEFSNYYTELKKMEEKLEKQQDK